MNIEQVKLKNYKSIRELKLTFGPINIMIGGNGVGKTNLISYFKFLNRLINKNLTNHVSRSGFADTFLYFGRKQSTFLSSVIIFSNGSSKNGYSFSLEPTTKDTFYFTEEGIAFKGTGNWIQYPLGEGHTETQLYAYNELDRGISGPRGVSHYVIDAFKGLRLYHFHDTSDTAKVKLPGDINDNRELREDASNLAAFLYKLKEIYPATYGQIESTIQRIAPFFQEFNLKPNELSPDKIQLEWFEKGSDAYFNASSLSDGTLRMMCLVTLLLQPKPPATIIIDEPELGLHPTAIHLLASIIKSVATRVQIIVSTQSVTLINQFTPDDLIVVERADGQSIFRRLDGDELDNWLEDYALGELWEKNVIGGRP